MIDVKNLSKSFGDHLVLDDITESIQVGEKVVIIGPSGSGKSTFLRCLNLLETPTKGTITFNGTEITDPKAKIDQIRQQMGMVFQHFNLFPNMTIRKNITLAPVRTKLLTQAEADDTATTLLRRVGLEDKADSYPAQLSGGQQQRVAIARALATHPKVLLCDEATSALDPNTTHAILELIRKINKKLGITVVIITHQMSVVKEICSHVAILDGGVVAESGMVGTVFAAPKSAAGRRLVFPGGADAQVYDPAGERLVRLVFKDSKTTSTPMVARLAAEEGIFCNVISASTQSLSEEVYGTMMLGIPSAHFDRAVKFIQTIANVQVEEVDHNVQ